ncbi:MAG: GxxExxY protein, partial [Bacteroidota bacterium]
RLREKQSLATSQRTQRETTMNENELSKLILDYCFKIHRELGPGLLESVYEEILYYELTKHGLKCDRQLGIPVHYEDVKMELGFRADLIVENRVIIELKSVETVLPVHKKQLLTYLKLTGLKLGLLVNFNEALLKDGITRIVNKL